jgi:hypothetical protein
VGSAGDAPAAFTLTGLQARAADYYTLIRPPIAQDCLFGYFP